MGTNLTLKKKMTRYTSDFKNIENLIFQVIASLNRLLCNCYILFVDNFIGNARRILPPAALTLAYHTTKVIGEFLVPEPPAYATEAFRYKTGREPCPPFA